MNKITSLTLALIIGGIAGGSLVYLLAPVKHIMAPSGPENDLQAGNGERQILYWVAPMDPNYRRDKPGKSPMGMDLIPVYQDEDTGTDDKQTVSINPEVVNNLGVRTGTVSRRDLKREINTVGYVNFDESRISHIHLRTEGWIHDLKVNAEGERVRDGELLFTLYSPVLVNAQQEYIQAIAGGNRGLIDASRERLMALGLTGRHIRELESAGKAVEHVPTYAPQSGIVYNLNVRHGMYVKPETEVMALAELDSIWLQAEVMERQASWVKPGQRAQASVSSIPGRIWVGEVGYVYPDLDPKTRTLRVRLRFDNSDEMLLPNMYAQVTIFGDGKDNVLTIPSEALIRVGGSQRVIQALGDGRFQPREIKTGLESGDYIEVVDGVDEGDQIVVSAQFLIDSEASVKASMQRMQPMDGTGKDMEIDETEILRKGIPTMGTVTGIVPETRVIRIEHEPVPELEWPVMNMEFNLMPGQSLDSINVGDRIHFTLTIDDQYRYAVNAIHVMGQAAAAGQSMPEKGNVITAMGTVRKVDKEENKLNIRHDPIEALGWPVMTMDFEVKDTILIDEIKAGDSVRFNLEQDEDETYIITDIEITDAGGQDE